MAFLMFLPSGCFRSPVRNYLLVLLLLKIFFFGVELHGTEKEYAVKAAFVFNLTRFVEWPDKGEANDEAAFTIGIWGADPFGGSLKKIVEDQRVRGRPIVVRHVTRLVEIASCEILFVDGADPEEMNGIVLAAERYGVLTVGEDDFARRRGMVGLVKKENRVSLEVNLLTTRLAGLNMSSRLLRLATLVPEAKEGNE